MNKGLLSRFRSSLTEHRNGLLEWFSDSSISTKKHVCECGQESEGIIAENNPPIISEIDKSIDQIDQGDFGKCCVCNEEVETELLEFDYKANVCLDHYTETERRELESDLELASKVQKHLLPHSLPAMQNIEMAALSKPARIVGGDYYDFFCYRSCLQGLAIADVMGKGLPASMLMSNLQASLRIIGPDMDELNSVLTRLNELFRYNLKLIRFISIFLAAIDEKNDLLHYSNAGHHPPVLWSQATNSIKLLNPTGPAIGLMPEPKYKSETVEFKEGDLLLLYTDGLVEARNSVGEEFGEERLEFFVNNHHTKNANDFLDQLRKEVEAFAEKIDDDLTMLVIKNQ